jgi:tetratricopeptide (TPR) repeat protein
MDRFEARRGPGLEQQMAQTAQADTQATLASALEAHQAGRREVAESLYRAVLADDPAEPTGLYLLGLLMFETGRPAQARGLFEQVVAARPDRAESHLALANLHHWLGDFALAIDGYRQALTVNPAHPGALVGLANALRDGGDAEAATIAARAAVAALPAEPTARLALGGALLAAGRAMEAARAYRAALDLDGGLLEARASLALALLGAGDNLGALEASNAALGLNEALVEAQYVRGAALLALHRPGEAVGALERVVALDPGRAAGHLNLGNAYTALQRGEDAERAFLRALALDPTLKEAHASLGSFYLLTGDSEAAERHCWLALAADPGLIVAHQNLAAIAAERGEEETARHHRREAYGRQNLFVEPAAEPVRTVLVLTTADGGNVPHRYLLPADRYTRINWFIEFAAEGQAAQLPPHDLIFNAVGDADHAGPTRAPTEALLAATDKPFFNHPRAVALTHRDNLATLLGDIDGLVVPRAARLGAEALAEQGRADTLASAGLGFPLIVRPIGSHGGKGLVRVDDPEDLAEAAAGSVRGAYATQYVEFADDNSLYRKYRMIFVDRRPYPYHLAIADHWLVHYETAGMPDYPRRLAEESRFLADPAAAIGESALAAVTAIGRRLDLDYAGVDFSILPDGRVLVFEANATMLVHPEAQDGPLAHKNPYVATILQAFQAMIAGR